ncbi:2-oxoglutarate dehydrogenase E1 component, mitochondrial precursor, putative [Brugia malayi]|uniref:2-oxoglutarate dehydrogenase, mitochondrial n=1 Tax=Brugia malayi TaxID=6279 RepID=A0A0H5S5J7_BRUMA|nr:2-oxoglutarate dehydrogenase E1 component, mitochondrial precursor, putative [Brugia malayi]CRZ23457.1 BMA-OGDH-1 [Brugia malayi]VIO87576.1 2-oxoglutarate dehydrogenase E1 component, mitochondrial precursor, putative [Brugia malayi]
MLRRTSFLKNKASLKLLGRLKCISYTLSKSNLMGKQCIVSGLRQKFAAAPVKEEPFMNGTSTVYIEQMYEAWRQSPTSVHSSWNAYFRNVERSLPPGQAYSAPPKGLPSYSVSSAVAPAPESECALSLSGQTINEHLKVQLLIRSYQTRGHNIADLDPLGINNVGLTDIMPAELDPAFYGLTDTDMDKEFLLPMSTFIGGDKKSLKLRDIISRLKTIYCSHTGIEYMHLTNFEQLEWVRKRFEEPCASELTHEQKKTLFKRLIRSTKFEEFLAKKWPSEKRFGLEGCEVLIPAAKQVIDVSSAAGVDSVVIGMPHRGRLNMLANVCRQPLSVILSQFSTLEPADEGSGDVKYHLGISLERLNRVSGRKIKIAVVANPSHLEAVDPIVLGKVRAESFYNGDENGDRTMAILLHGDAAFSGQGVVMETFNLNDLKAYSTHGTIHLVVNNQIGFTTDPRCSRSSPYCTDIGRVVGCPIFHVNSDDPEAVMHVCNVAADWRRTFKKDVIIDLVCYRRYGHNELDEPMFTQPLMYQRVKKTKPVLAIYQKQILAENVVNEQYVEDEVNKYNAVLEDAYQEAQKVAYLRHRDWIDSPWDTFFKKRDPLKIPATGVAKEMISHIIEKFSSVPEDFNLHRGLDRILKGRRQMFQDNSFDWAMGEAVAFGSLLLEGTHVRLSGQDVERGTFSHRHHVLHDQKIDQKTYNPLDNLSDKQVEYSISNSSLSEFAILGFELGYSMVNPNSLVIWEAQFGDFANNAQCIIDQFLSSGQSKWIRQSGLVMSLPHGYEGMGPEHSSARLERFLQMSNEDDEIDVDHTAFGPTFEAQQLYDTNWIVVHCTTPSNFCHLLRRQIMLPFRKPLIIMSPKSLLRHPSARSPIEDFLPGTKFCRVIPEGGSASQDPDKVERLVFCTGKVYYDLMSARKHLNLDSRIAISRVEQISPFPYDLIEKECLKYSKAELIWAQEEHKNMGAWGFVHPRLGALITKQGRLLKYAGRKPSASAATGNKYTHYVELKTLLADALHARKADLDEFIGG